MSRFDPSMLTASPEPETPPSPTRDQPVIDDSIPEESNEDRINHAWSLICETLRSCALTAPAAKEELMEDQETWMRDWRTVLEQMNKCFGRAQDVQVELTLDAQGAQALEDGKKEYWVLERLMRGWTVKATEPPREKSAAPTNDAGVTTTVEKEALPAAMLAKEVANMGIPVSTSVVGRMSVTKEKCARCQNRTGMCDGSPGVRCSYCAGVKQACSFSRKAEPKAKPQARTRTTPPRGAAPAKKARTGSMSLARPTVPATTVEGAESSESESETVLPRPVLPLPKQSVPMPKRKLDASERDELEALCIEVASLQEENVELRARTKRYGETLIHAHQYVRVQEAEQLLASNKAFSSVCGWRSLELEIAKLFH
ncbi:uncharacterized protein F5147DRAFT_783389 [Suillus discolor]|uniref:Zn(2)-C6 fungal-type domain-containing protein n=1 Tax=Suillus discolor TaxID=1912936 RepID=A0A9P7JKY5_9AGAM|nr:uncharacterized protein F5147DRAFT_783389 [Suillus discolor]KAG2082174.1 hypothetical protein F5147DRAFT_783389 [Suillus discolor]